MRRTSQPAVGDVLAGLQHSPAALGAASEAVLKLCQKVLPGPEAAAHAAAAAPSKKRQAAEEAIAAAVADALHLLGALKQWLPLLSGACLVGWLVRVRWGCCCSWSCCTCASVCLHAFHIRAPQLPPGSDDDSLLYLVSF